MKISLSLLALIAVFVIASFQSIALPTHSVYRAYYASAEMKIPVGIYSIGCTRANFREGNYTSFYQDDPNTINCSLMGERIDEFGSCFTNPNNSFDWEDKDKDGNIEGYKKLYYCINPIWKAISVSDLDTGYCGPENNQC